MHIFCFYRSTIAHLNALLISWSRIIQFKEFSQAADVLMDKEKRAMYDQYGKEGLEEGGGGGGGAEDILSQMFGGGRRGPRGPQKGEDIWKIWNFVALSDLIFFTSWGKTSRGTGNRLYY